MVSLEINNDCATLDEKNLYLICINIMRNYDWMKLDLPFLAT